MRLACWGCSNLSRTQVVGEILREANVLSTQAAILGAGCPLIARWAFASVP